MMLPNSLLPTSVSKELLKLLPWKMICRIHKTVSFTRRSNKYKERGCSASKKKSSKRKPPTTSLSKRTLKASPSSSRQLTSKCTQTSRRRSYRFGRRRLLTVDKKPRRWGRKALSGYSNLKRESIFGIRKGKIQNHINKI